MSRIKIILLIAAVGGMQLPSMAQRNTNSPYSRYGYGILSDRSIGMGHAMGGIGYGLQSPSQINVLNPASYAAVDSMTFLFDFGVDFNISWMKEKDNRLKSYNGNIKNVNLLFPLSKSLAFSAGLTPVTAVGYEYSNVESNGQTDYSGTGGILQVYGGLAYKYRDFSVGANIGYLFGTTEHYSVTPITNPNVDSILIRVHDMTFTLGVQQKISLNEKHALVLGLAYTPKIRTTGKFTHSRWTGSNLNTAEVRTGFDMAQTVGFGASWQMQDKWLIGADVQWENWKDARFGGEKNELNDRWRYGAGVEYTPDARNRSYFKRTKYRFGSYYTNSYITTDKGCSYNEFGLSAGVALPVTHGRSVLHLSLDYVNVVPSISHLLSENYFKVTLNYTFNETWFYKWRIK
jgi:long-subunit fatty acid transport protein